jgi:predicted Zn finger-like uncharacterized protein
MPFTISCPSCQSELRVREEYAGKQLKCPRCSETLDVPAQPPAEVIPLDPALREHVEEVRPGPRGPQPPVLATAVEEGPPDRRGGRSGPGEGRRGRRPAVYQPCPRCGAEGARRVTWTPWGSFYGPSLLTHVRCPGCGYAYNGRTGRSNAVGIFFFTLIPFLLLVGINLGLWFAVGRQIPGLLFVLFAIEAVVVLVLVVLALVQGSGGHERPPSEPPASPGQGVVSKP